MSKENISRLYLPLPPDEHVIIFRRNLVLWNLALVPSRPILEMDRSHFQLLVDLNRLSTLVEFTAAQRKCPLKSLVFVFSFNLVLLLYHVVVNIFILLLLKKLKRVKLLSTDNCYRRRWKRWLVIGHIKDWL